MDSFFKAFIRYDCKALHSVNNLFNSPINYLNYLKHKWFYKLT